MVDPVHISKVNILGVNISVLSLSGAMEAIDGFIASRGFYYVCFSNVHTVMISFDAPDFRRITNDADLALPDGTPLVWAARLLGHDLRERVYGPDLMLALCERGVHKGYAHFFYGGGEGVPELLSRNLSARFPGLKVAGFYSPPFRPLSAQEDEEVIKMINDSGAHFLWVGLGAPKQERWMADHLNRIKVPVMLGVGAAFDFLSGKVKQAPDWMQRQGLEWFFRLMVEPKRLWKRYLYNNPRFIYHISKQILLNYLKEKHPTKNWSHI
jgi:N-acetylglucosaminyldiphosphoundecaprenol N-acetyl-beta-D-mannosaminyltransferase